MPHKHLGFPFGMRAACKMNLGDPVSLETAREEFERLYPLRGDLRDGDSKAQFEVFEAEARNGGTIRRFSGQPIGPYQSIYPCRGFVLVRDGIVTGGVVTETAIDHEGIHREVQELMEFSGDFTIDVEAEERDLIAEKLERRVADYWPGINP